MVSLKHAKESTLVDSPDETLIRPSDWNAEHILELAAGDRILGRGDTPGAVQELSVGDGLFIDGTELRVRIDTEKGLSFVTGLLGINIGTGLEFDVDGKLKTSAVAIPDAVPSGSLIAMARNTAPTGWLKANGAAVSRTTYADLFAAIGTTFGAGNGSTTFNLPDLRGEFVRGWDDARGVDTGRVFGSAQGEAIQSHSHTASSNTTGAHTHSITNGNTGSGSPGTATAATQGPTSGAVTSGYTAASNGNHSHTITVNAAGGPETRPRNIAMLYCIKV
jgi:phage-related tail fiber protein